MVKVIDFVCYKDFAECSDSMLFETGTEIAYGKIEKDNGDIYNIYLEVRGEVEVEYKGKTYYSVYEFPNELTEIIKNNPRNWMFETDDLYVYLSNWFEYIYMIEGSIISDGVMYDGILYNDTKESVLEDMMNIVEQN